MKELVFHYVQLNTIQINQEYVIDVMDYVKYATVNIIVLHVWLDMHMMDIVIVHVQEALMLILSLKNAKIVTLNVHNVFLNQHIVLNAQVDSMFIKETVHQHVHQVPMKIMHNV